MKKVIYLTFLFMIVTILVSCQNDKPKPETKREFSLVAPESAYASSFVTEEKEDPFFVKHHVKERDVYIECIVKGASFREKNAKIIVYIDGKKKEEITNSAFVLKGLKPGKHQIQLQLKKAKNSNSGIIEEFNVLVK
jgi:hypothetical protein